uniref:Uncharacterized protein n=1 Tax=Ditylenchus dipsaci TaxID=166011 RepID=A0A915D354_9BILA
MDLTGRTPVYSENFSGMIPLNLEASDLDEKFPIISKLLDSEDNSSTINAESFNALQKAIEELLAEMRVPNYRAQRQANAHLSVEPRTSTETAKRIQADEGPGFSY